MLSTLEKVDTLRRAKAQSRITMARETLERLQMDDLPKKGVLQTARIAGLLAAKRTPDLIPHCHAIAIDGVEVDFTFEENSVRVTAQVETLAKTGVEMEALVAASMAALTLYDMLKVIDKDMEIVETRLLEKTGGKSDFYEKLAPDFRVVVIVTDEAIFTGKKPDKHKESIGKILGRFGVENFSYQVLPGNPDKIRHTLFQFCEEKVPLIFTVGGSGLDAQDQTVDLVEGLIERTIPGVMEAARSYGQRRSPYAMLSRGIAGQKGESIIVTLPGSTRGVKESLQAILPGLLHGLNVLRIKGR